MKNKEAVSNTGKEVIETPAKVLSTSVETGGRIKVKLSTGEVVEGRRGKVKDMKLVNHLKDDMEREIALIVNLTQKTPEEIEELDINDYGKLQQALLW